LQTALNAERAMTSGLSERIKLLEKKFDDAELQRKMLEEEKSGLEETVRDLMFALDAGQKIAELGGEGGEGGDVLAVPTQANGTAIGNNGKRKSGKARK
jgi:BRCA1-associated protein